MSTSQSKLMVQLNKQQKISQKIIFSEQKIQDLYTTICKIQPKNLMLVEFLTLIIQKNLVKNSFKIQTFVEMYEQVKGKKLQQQQNTFNKASNGQKDQQKFNKKKFLKLLKDVAKLLYPGDSKAYQTTLYLKLIMPDAEQNRMKVDDNLKKYLNEQLISVLNVYQKQFQVLFQTYMPQNYNQKLQFSWNQLRLLQKKLPILCLLRILFQSQLCPQSISPTQFLQLTSKLLPASNLNHKQAMFYYSQTFNNYMRQYIFLDEIKLLQGDIGLTFLQFQILMVKIATQYCKENKQQFGKYVEKFMKVIGISEIIKNKKQIAKMTKLQTNILNYIKDNQKNNGSTKPHLKKQCLLKKERKQLNELIQSTQDNQHINIDDNIKKLQHQSLLITKEDLMKIKKNLDDQLGPIPQKPVIDKQNQGYYNFKQKFIVIGDQPPKTQQKNKPAAKPTQKQKPQDQFLGYKPQQQPQQQSKSNNIILNRKRKLRINTQYPIILTQVFYPNSFKDQSLLKLKEEQQIYLQTAYIHLGERMYEEAYVNFQKARNMYMNVKSVKNQKKNVAVEFYFSILQAQIFQSSGKDQAALVHYFNSKQLSSSLPLSQLPSKAFCYLGLSSSLYHLQQYQFSLRCLLKAKQIYGQLLQTQSIQNSILLNNIASCYMMMNRNQEAMKYFSISHQILDLKVGRFDERTLVVQRNIAKNKKAYIQQMPSFKTMWKTYVQKNNSLTAAKAVKAKGKK